MLALIQEDIIILVILQDGMVDITIRAGMAAAGDITVAGDTGVDMVITVAAGMVVVGVITAAMAVDNPPNFI